jgi:alpha-glucuronidase
VDDERYADVLKQLNYQAGHSIVWRDAINNWFHDMSGIADDKGRVGHHPDRFEAEAMELDGYAPFVPASWEGASGGKGVLCPEGKATCNAQMKFEGGTGRYEIDVEYFDLSNGLAHFKVFVDDKMVDEWNADDHLPGRAPSADSSVRRRIPNVELHSGETIRIEGVPDIADRAGLDYIEVLPLQH